MVTLIPTTLEIVTAIAISLMVAILIVYLSLLKRNGWIGEASGYRCPNPQCKKVFQTPLKVKDFSSKKEVGLACPECGYDLGSFKDGKGVRETTLQSEPELKIQESTSKPNETGVLTTNNEIKEPKALTTSPPTAESKENMSPPKIDRSLPRKKLNDPKKDEPACCNHYVGYLGTLPANVETLDECYFCPRLVECCVKARE